MGTNWKGSLLADSLKWTAVAILGNCYVPFTNIGSLECSGVRRLLYKRHTKHSNIHLQCALGDLPGLLAILKYS